MINRILVHIFDTQIIRKKKKCSGSTLNWFDHTKINRFDQSPNMTDLPNLVTISLINGINTKIRITVILCIKFNLILYMMRLIISCSSRLNNIIRFLWVRFDDNLSWTIGALKIEPIYFNPVVRLHMNRWKLNVLRQTKWKINNILL